MIAVDPFYLGESRISERDFLYALLVSSVSERALGLQASQLGAVARWLRSTVGGETVSLVARGRRSSLAALVAGALEEEAISSVELRGSLGTLKEVIEENTSVESAPELFCFGLLEALDIRDLAALVAPRPARFPDASDRVEEEIAPLEAWCRTLGGELPSTSRATR